MSNKLKLVGAALYLIKDSHKFVSALRKYAGLHLGRYFAAQALALGLASVSFTFLIPLIRRGPENAPEDIARSYELFGFNFELQLTWYAPFFMVSCALAVLYLAKKSELKIVTRAASAITAFLQNSTLSSPDALDSTALQKLTARSAKVVRWYIIMGTEVLKAAACIGLVWIINSKAIYALGFSLIALTAFSLWSYRSPTDGDNQKAGEEANGLGEFISFKLALSKLSIGFSGLMPTFLVVSLLWDQLVVPEWFVGRDLLLLCLIVSYAGPCLGKAAQGLYRISQMDPIWRHLSLALNRGEPRLIEEQLSKWVPNGRGDDG